ncbi:uncharacterized protein LAESUDRAFT_652064 [Laetiporus sulphureus 93-53]|uniref:Arrestin-like N-terminal domain-containing protein n=1 Tax=Laetiporus sulphureus 93-53 TaxID=1314785 RepID=A0A165EHG1_9APHY|nr:uncharacterized protein LAESUDRAFT_652064 [Laetiporus sulphureus 93-53]KZT07060.1 hypothetical protein LAESUDRAFT_652064 [Laetiporus sulphureus 93-53]
MAPPSVTVYTLRGGFLAGDVFYGTVELNFRALQEEQVEEVHVKLRGYAATSIFRNNQRARQIVELVRLDQSLWTRGTLYPPPGSDVLSIPFRFLLPAELPPSFIFRHPVADAYIRYHVEAVGVRPGLLKMNKRCLRPFIVFTPDEAGSLVKPELQIGQLWTGAWLTATEHKRIRRAFWGDYGDVQLEFKRPSAVVYPVLSDIPFVITIATISKPIKLEDGKKPWPSPPLEPSAVHLELKHTVWVQAGIWDQTSTQTLTSLGGMGGSIGSVSIETHEDEWLPDDEDKKKGRWRKKVSFSSSFKLKHTPTFNFPFITLEYFLHVKVHFGGLLNSLSIDIPTTVGSGMTPLTGDVDLDNQRDEALPRFEDLDLPP